MKQYLKHPAMAALSFALLGAIGAQAQTTPPPGGQATSPAGAQQQQQQQQAMPQPTAASPQDAAKCTQTAQTIVAALDKGDYAGASNTFDPALRQKLSADQLKQGYQSLTQKFGKRSSMGQSRSVQLSDATVTLIPMQYQKGMLGVQVACSKQGKALGLQIGPMPANKSSS